MYRKLIGNNQGGEFIEEWNTQIKDADDLGEAQKGFRKALEKTTGTKPIENKSVNASTVRFAGSSWYLCYAHCRENGFIWYAMNPYI